MQGLTVQCLLECRIHECCIHTYHIDVMLALFGLAADLQQLELLVNSVHSICIVYMTDGVWGVYTKIF